MSRTHTRPAAHPNAVLAAALRVAAVAVLGLAVAAIALPGSAGDRAEWVMVAVLIATPLGRVGWLAVRWTRQRDWLFAGLAAGLLAFTGVAAMIAALTE